MTFWAQVSLAIIAGATLIMAVVQLGVIVYGWVLARRVARIIDDVERELGSVMESLNAIAREAARATSLAAVQVDRFDKVFEDLSSRVEHTAATVQQAIIAPLREGAAVMAGLRAAMAVLRESTKRSGGPATPSEEEQGLFIG